MANDRACSTWTAILAFGSTAILLKSQGYAIRVNQQGNRREKKYYNNGWKGTRTVEGWDQFGR
jgi:hypothetical protein